MYSSYFGAKFFHPISNRNDFFYSFFLFYFFFLCFKFSFSIFFSFFVWCKNVETAVLPSMIHRKSGRLIFISSVAGKVPIPFRSSFAASKHALQAFCDSLRAEIAMHNVKVLVSSPEYIACDLSRNDVVRAGTFNEGKLLSIIDF